MLLISNLVGCQQGPGGIRYDDDALAGDSSADMTGDTLVPPTAPSLDIQTADGALVFSWNEPGRRFTETGDTQTQLGQNFRSTSVYVLQAGQENRLFNTEDPTATRFALDVTQFDIDWQHHLFILEHCTADDCVRSYARSIEHLQFTTKGSVGADPAVFKSRYGHAISSTANGNLLVSGAPGTDIDGFAGAGQVHVQFHVEDSWYTAATLTSDTPFSGQGLGSSVSSSADGNVIAASAPAILSEQPASIYLYERFGETWMETMQIPAPEDLENFGQQVVLSADGQSLFVSATRSLSENPSDDLNTDQPAVTSVVLYYQRVSTQWLHQQTITTAPGIATGALPQAVATDASGSALAIRVASDNTVRFFRKQSGSFVAQQTITLEYGDMPDPGSGLALSADANVLAVTEREFVYTVKTANPLKNPQTVVRVMQTGQNGRWYNVERLYPSGVNSHDTRASVALSDDGSVIAVALTDRDGSNSMVSTFSGKPKKTDTDERPGWSVDFIVGNPTTPESDYGTSLAISGDGNHVYVGAPKAKSGDVSQAGRIYLY